MSGVVTKLKIGTAALAAVAVAGLTPVISQAAPGDSDSDSGSVGTSAGKAPTRANRGNKSQASAPSNDSSPAADSAPGTDAAPGASPSADATASATGSNPLIQNPLIWIGSPNPTPPPSTPIYGFQPLADLPEFSRPMFGWMKDFEFEACVLGLSTVNRGQSVVGPYGTSTTGFSSSGC